MKTLSLLIIWNILMFASTSAWSQVRFDVVAGISPGVNPKTHEKLMNRRFVSDEFMFSIDRIEKQFHIGINANLTLSAPFFAEAGISYTQRKSEFGVAYTYPNEVHLPYNKMAETEKVLMVPLSIGVAVGKVDMTSGLNLIGVISKKTSMTSLQGYETEEPFLRAGWHAGVRHTIGRSMIGIQYQSSFDRLGANTSLNGESLELNHVPGQFVFTAHFMLTKRK